MECLFARKKSSIFADILKNGDIIDNKDIRDVW
ncbi:MAG: hypothetical protein ACI9XO_001948 [Paraglaciecola sp.]